MDEHAKETAEKSGLTQRPGLTTLKLAYKELAEECEGAPCLALQAAKGYVYSAIQVLEDNPPVKDEDGS